MEEEIKEKEVNSKFWLYKVSVILLIFSCLRFLKADLSRVYPRMGYEWYTILTAAILAFTYFFLLIESPKKNRTKHIVSGIAIVLTICLNLYAKEFANF